MSKNKPEVVLTTTVLDLLAFTSASFGGIGVGSNYNKVDYSVFPPKVDEPVDVAAQIHFATRGGHETEYSKLAPDATTSESQVALTVASEQVIHTINKERKQSPDARVPFDKWLAGLHEQFDVIVVDDAV